MTVKGTIMGMAERAKPTFALGAVGIPILSFIVGVTVGTTAIHTYVHVMAGVLWTGIDVFMALVVGPVLAGLTVEERANWFERFTPKMAFLLPTLATVTIFGGITLAVRLGVFPNSGPWIGLFVFVAFGAAVMLMGWVFDAFHDRRWQGFLALVLLGNGGYFGWEFIKSGLELPETSPLILVILGVMTVLTVQGFGVLLPNEIRIYLELISDSPDEERIARLGLLNAKLSGVQGVFQLGIILLMVYLRWGGL